MPLGMARNPNAGSASPAAQPISRSLAFTILSALAVLILLRHLFGSIRLEVGTR